MPPRLHQREDAGPPLGLLALLLMLGPLLTVMGGVVRSWRWQQQRQRRGRRHEEEEEEDDEQAERGMELREAARGGSAGREWEPLMGPRRRDEVVGIGYGAL